MLSNNLKFNHSITLAHYFKEKLLQFFCVREFWYSEDVSVFSYMCDCCILLFFVGKLMHVKMST